MSGTGCCYDNAVTERFFWSLKDEWTSTKAFEMTMARSEAYSQVYRDLLKPRASSSRLVTNLQTTSKPITPRLLRRNKDSPPLSESPYSCFMACRSQHGRSARLLTSQEQFRRAGRDLRRAKAHRWVVPSKIGGRTDTIDKDTQRLATNRKSNRGRLSSDFRARRRALAADECSDDDDLRLTIRTSQGRGQRVAVRLASLK